MATIYTDGSCKNKKGGWGFISLDSTGDWHVSGSETNTTNNRMELVAVIEAIDFHSNYKELIIYSDSQLTINCAQGLWNRKKNKDLWTKYDQKVKGKKIIFKKVKAHSGNHYNELVDNLAKTACRTEK